MTVGNLGVSADLTRSSLTVNFCESSEDKEKLQPQSLTIRTKTNTETKNKQKPGLT